MKRGITFLLLGWLLSFKVAFAGAPAGVTQHAAGTTSDSVKPTVIMLSLDGFRTDYLSAELTPNLYGIAQRGLLAEGFIPGFPSSTFPSHYSIVTGLYPGRHGIIGNNFYDPSRMQDYRMRDRRAVEDGSWYGGEPLWVAAEKAGLRATSFFWVGSEADVAGVRPSAWRRFDSSVPNDSRVEQVLEWVADDAEEHADLVTFYFSDVDSAGHAHGPNSQQVMDAVARVDRSVGKLMRGIDTLNQQVYLFVVSDHGMAAVDFSQQIFLRDYLDLKEWYGQAKIVLGGAFAYFYSDDEAQLRDAKSRLGRAESLRVYLRDEFPPELGFARSEVAKFDRARIPNMIALAPAQGYINISRSQQRKPPKGAHGYLPSELSNMNGLLLAQGPRIKPGSRPPAIDNVHVYPWIMELLSLPVAGPIDGDLTVLAPYFR